MTAAATRAYQASRGLPQSGVLDEATFRKLAGEGYFTASPITPPWIAEARRNMGVAEIAGPRHSPVIMGWVQRLGAKVLGINVRDDETAWCGTFVAMCVAVSLPAEPLPSVAVRASAWDDFGVGLAEPALGAILRFERAGGGHVGFYLGEDATHYHVLGGNQGNRVSVMRLEKARLRATRWPRTVARPTSGRVHLTPTGVALSTSEA